MDTGCTGHLGKTLYGTFNVLASNHHQVGHFVDDDDDIGHWRQVEFFLNIGRLARFLVKAGLHRAHHGFALALGRCGALIETLDVAHTKASHLAIAVFHLAHSPFQRHDRLFRIGHNWRKQMRDAVIDR